jgi:hypothetical protein
MPRCHQGVSSNPGTATSLHCHCRFRSASAFLTPPCPSHPRPRSAPISTPCSARNPAEYSRRSSACSAASTWPRMRCTMRSMPLCNVGPWRASRRIRAHGSSQPRASRRSTRSDAARDSMHRRIISPTRCTATPSPRAPTTTNCLTTGSSSSLPAVTPPLRPKPAPRSRCAKYAG